MAADARDNVEQVRAAGLGSAIVKVKAASGIDGTDAEPFGLAAEASIQPLATPNLAFENVSLSRSSLRVGETASLSADVVNTSTGADLSTGVMLRQLDAALSTPGRAFFFDRYTDFKQRRTGTPDRHGVSHSRFRPTSRAATRFKPRPVACGSERLFHQHLNRSRCMSMTPRLSFSSTPRNSWFASRTAIVSWTASDQVSGVEFVEVQSSIDGGSLHHGLLRPRQVWVSTHFCFRRSDRACARPRNRRSRKPVELHRAAHLDGRRRGTTDRPAGPRQSRLRRSCPGSRARVQRGCAGHGVCPLPLLAAAHAVLDGGSAIIPAVARQGKPVTVEAQRSTRSTGSCVARRRYTPLQTRSV